MSGELRFHLADEAATLGLGAELARICGGGAIIYPEGELGAGKTTLSRGLLTALGHRGAVKSPTYTLVESYTLGSVQVHHFDLYRLADAEELEYMGIRDYFSEATLALIEWPQRGTGLLPPADIVVDFQLVNNGREVSLSARTLRGEQLLQTLNNKKD